MASTHPSSHGQPDALALVSSKLNTYWSNLSNQTTSAFKRLTPQDAIRLVVVVCGYALIIRPLLIKLGARVQAQAHEADAAEGSAAMGANDLRGGRARKVAIPGVDSDSDEDEGDVKADAVEGEWGRRARVRQRKIVRRALEIKEQTGLDEDDEDIKQFMED